MQKQSCLPATPGFFRFVSRLGTMASCALLLAGAAKASTNPPSWNSTVTYTNGDLVVGPEGNYYRCVVKNTNHSPWTDAGPAQGGFWQLNHTFVPTTLVVGTSLRFHRIEYAMDFVHDATLTNPVTISIPNAFSETPATAIDLDNSFGANIQIIASSSPNAPCIITPPAGDSGFFLNGGYTFGGISNVTVMGSAKSGVSNYGFSLAAGCNLLNVDDVTVDGFTDGVYMITSARMTSTNLAIKNCSFAGISVDGDSSISCPDVTINGGGTGLYGIFITNRGHVTTSNATIENLSPPLGIGINESVESAATITGSTIDAWLGLNIVGHSMIHAVSCKITSTLPTTVKVYFDSYINLQGSTLSPVLGPLAFPDGVLTSTATTVLGNDGSCILKP